MFYGTWHSCVLNRDYVMIGELMDGLTMNGGSVCQAVVALWEGSDGFVHTLLKNIEVNVNRTRYMSNVLVHC